MGLNLIRRGPETIRLTVPPGTGIQSASRDGSIYTLRGYNTWVHVTVTATGCDGLAVQDRENGYDKETRSSSEGAVSYSGVFYASSYGPVVQIVNPTDKTEVIMHVVPIPPPLLRRTFAALVGWLAWR